MDYAVRVVRALKDGTKVSATEVAKKEHLPQAITYKVLFKMRPFTDYIV